VAIYYHKDSSADALDGPGGEYMASSIVRGSPSECLRVLLNPASHTTILGPASSIEELDATAERQARARCAQQRRRRRRRLRPPCFPPAPRRCCSTPRCAARAELPSSSTSRPSTPFKPASPSNPPKPKPKSKPKST